MLNPLGRLFKNKLINNIKIIFKLFVYKNIIKKLFFNFLFIKKLLFGLLKNEYFI